MINEKDAAASGVYFGELMAAGARLLQALTPFVKDPTDRAFLQTFGDATGAFLEEATAADDRLRKALGR